MPSFAFGPFTFTPGRALRVAGTASRYWAMHYGATELAEQALPDPVTRSDIIEAFSSPRQDFERAARDENAPDRIDLIDVETGDPAAHFYSDAMCGMTPGLIDDSSRYWLRSADRLRSRPVTLSEFAQVAAENSAPALSWITGLLPDAVMTAAPDEWRSPTSWEIRHIVGEGSFTRVSGAGAAALVGVTPQNFRKYTARDGASTRQGMSFAMWHLLLHKLGVQRA